MSVQGRLGSSAALVVAVALSVSLLAAPPGQASPVRVAATGASGLVAVDHASTMGLYALEKSWSASTVDFDGDGDEDVWIGYHQWTGKLWRNDGGHYTQAAPTAWPRVNPLSGKVPDRHDCTFADVDLDGRPDAYCSGGRNQSNLVKYGMENQLWLQLTPGTFTDVGIAWGVGDLCGRGRHVQFLNVNGDAYPDLFVGNAEERSVSDACDVASNGLPDEDSKIFINEGGTGYVQLADSGLTTAGVGQRCAVALDYDHDGWDDLATCRYNTQTPRLYHNVHGRFSDVSTANGFTKTLADIVVADLNGDGWDDLVTAAITGFSYRLNLHGSFGPDVSIGTASPAQGRSVAVGDADGDGDLDVYGLMADSSGSKNPDDVLFINDGNSFSRLPVPSASGNGDEVVAIHPRADGRTSFLVLNGGDPAGPVQVIEVVGTVQANQPPQPVFGTPTCSGLTCSVDGGSSTDPDGSVVAQSWDFGDGDTSSALATNHAYALAGTYTVTLTVTDNLGAQASASREVRVAEPGESTPIGFHGASAADTIGRSLSVGLPAGAAEGDLLLLFVTTNSLTPVVSTPAGWTLVRRQTDTTMQTQLFWRADVGGVPSSVAVTASTSGSMQAQLLAYTGAVLEAPLHAAAAEPTWRVTHTTPTLAVAPGDWVLSYWADKSSKGPTTGWMTPASVTRRLQVVPAGTTKRVTSVSADSGGPVTVTNAPAVTAQASIANNLATMWTVRLRPANP